METLTIILLSLFSSIIGGLICLSGMVLYIKIRPANDAEWDEPKKPFRFGAKQESEVIDRSDEVIAQEEREEREKKI